ncbi:MAG: type II secretion system F family protein [Bryobacteraceae bacterium]
MSIVLLTFSAAFILVAVVSLFILDRQQLRTRIAGVVRPQSEHRPGLLRRLFHKPSGEAVGKLVDPLQRLVPRNEMETSVNRRRLVHAGFRQPAQLELFYASKALCPLAMILLLTVTGTFGFGPFFGYTLGFAVGFLLPDYWLGSRIAERKRRLQQGLAEALDLMVVCVEAGLGLDQTIQRVALELQRSQPEVSDEFQMVYLEQRAGHSRAEAWRNLAERTDLDVIRALVAMLIQADQFGTSVATCLRVHSDSLRTRRRQKAEEAAAKTTVKLVFPLVFFIFPSLFVVVLGPSMIILIDSFDKYLLN